MKVTTILFLILAFIALGVAFYAHVFDGLLQGLGVFYSQNETIIKLALAAALFIALGVGFILVFVLKSTSFLRPPQHTLSPKEILDDWRRNDPIKYADISRTYDLLHPKVEAFLDDVTPTPRLYMEVSKKVTGQPAKARNFVLLFDAASIPNPLGNNRLKACGDKELLRIAYGAKDANDMAYRETDRSTYTDRVRELQAVAEENPELLPFLIPQSTASKMTVEK